MSRLLRHGTTAAIAFLLSISGSFAASAQQLEYVVSGTIRTGSDTSTPGRSVFGVVGRLDGFPFELVITIDVSRGERKSTGGSGDRRAGSEFSGRGALAARLTVNQVSVSIDPAGAGRASIARTLTIANDGTVTRSLLRLDLTEDSSTTRSAFVRSSLLTLPGHAFATDPDVLSPMPVYEVPSTDVCNGCTFAISQRLPEVSARLTATGAFTITRVEARVVSRSTAPRAEADPTLARHVRRSTAALHRSPPPAVPAERCWSSVGRATTQRRIGS